MSPQDIALLKSLSNDYKAALISLIIEVVNADNVIEYTEFLTVNQILQELEITDDLYAKGKTFDLLLAMHTIRPLSKECKTAVGLLLLECAEADRKIQPEEQCVLTKIFKTTGIHLTVF